MYVIFDRGDVGGGTSPPNSSSDWLYSMNAPTSYFSDPKKGWDGVLEDAKTYYPQWLSTMNSKGIAIVPNAYLRFNNTNNTNVSPPWAALRCDEADFRSMLKLHSTALITICVLPR